MEVCTEVCTEVRTEVCIITVVMLAIFYLELKLESLTRGIYQTHMQLNYYS